MTDDEHDFRHPKGDQIVKYEGENRLAGDLQEGLWRMMSVGAKAGTFPGKWNDRFHRPSQWCGEWWLSAPHYNASRGLSVTDPGTPCTMPPAIASPFTSRAMNRITKPVLLGVALGGMASNALTGVLVEHVSANAPYVAGGAGALLLALALPWLVPEPSRPPMGAEASAG